MNVLYSANRLSKRILKKSITPKNRDFRKSKTESINPNNRSFSVSKEAESGFRVKI